GAGGGAGEAAHLRAAQDRRGGGALNRRGLTRRDWLRAGGAAGLGLGLPLFGRRALAGAGGGATAPRLVLLMQSNGTAQSAFWPAAAPALAPSSPILSPILDDPALGPKTTVIKGLFNHESAAGNEHDRGF